MGLFGGLWMRFGSCRGDGRVRGGVGGSVLTHFGFRCRVVVWLRPGDGAVGVFATSGVFSRAVGGRPAGLRRQGSLVSRASWWGGEGCAVVTVS